MSTFRVHAMVYSLVSMFVRADDEREAEALVRERLAVDRLPSEYTTVLKSSSLVTRDGGRPPGVDPVEYKDHVDSRIDGIDLTKDQIAYCDGRGYGVGPDIDAFRGVQLMHLVDDGVAFCRTSALWFWDRGVKDLRGVARISCEMCLDILQRELRYPHPDLHVRCRVDGNRALARVVYSGDRTELTVNDVVIDSFERDPKADPNARNPEEDKQVAAMRSLCDQINRKPRVMPATPISAIDVDERRHRWRMLKCITISYALRSDDIEPSRRHALEDAVASLRAKMPQHDLDFVDGYLRRDERD